MADNAVVVEPAADQLRLVLTPRVRYWLFAGTFLLLIVLWALAVTGVYFTQSGVTGAVLVGIASFAPVVLSQLSIPGEVTPAILGGLVAWIAPPRSTLTQTFSLLVLAGLGWLAYLHLQIVFSSLEVQQLLLINNVEASEIKTHVGVLSNFTISIRNFCAVIFAAIIGLRLNSGIQVFNPTTPPPVPSNMEGGDSAGGNPAGGNGGGGNGPGAVVAGPAETVTPIPREPDDVPNPALGQTATSMDTPAAGVDDIKKGPVG